MSPTGTISGTPPTGATTTSTVTITAANGYAPNSTQTFTLTATDLDQELRTWTGSDPPLGTPVTNGPSLTANTIFNTVPGIFPGSILQGSQAGLAAGQVTPIPLQPGGGTLTLQGIQLSKGNSSTTVSSATEGNVSNAITQMTQNSSYFPNTGGITEMHFQQITSSSAAKLAVFGVLLLPGGGGASAFFSDADNQNESHTLFSFVQDYFTVDYSPSFQNGNNSFSAFFAPGTTTDDVAQCQCMGPGDPPVYVKSVTYGAEVYFLANSTASSQDVQAALSAAVNTGVQSGKVTVSYSQASTLDQTSIDVLTAGVGSSQQAPLLGLSNGGAAAGQDILQGLQQFIQLQEANGADAADVSIPISYTLGYLDEQTLGEYPAVTSGPVPAASGLVSGLYVTFTDNGDDKNWQDPVYVSSTSPGGQPLYTRGTPSACDTGQNNFIASPGTNQPQNYWNDGDVVSMTIPFTDANCNPISIPAYQLADTDVGISSPKKPGSDSWEGFVTVTTKPATGSTANYLLLTTDNLGFQGNPGDCQAEGQLDGTAYTIPLWEPGDGADASAPTCMGPSSTVSAGPFRGNPTRPPVPHCSVAGTRLYPPLRKDSRR